MKMAQTNFTLLINLSNFFQDHRKIARIFIGEKITRIKDIENKITKVFGVENFVLVSNNEYLPPSEDIRILGKDDIIWAIPEKNSNLSYKNIDVENEYSPIEIKKTKRKSNSAVNGTDDVVYKKRKKEDYARGEPSKSEGKTEEIEDNTKSKSKKKKKHIYEKVQPEDEYIPRISKKKKYKDMEQTGTEKVQKQIENSKKKSVSESNKYNYLEKSINEYQVTVGNSLPENVSFKKITQIPTITDEYLREKKINIVKIDYVSKPPAANQIEASSTDTFDTEPIQNENEVLKNSSEASSAHKIEIGLMKNSSEASSAHKIEIGPLQNENEIRKNSSEASSANQIEIVSLQNENEIKKKYLDCNETKSSSIKSDSGIERTTKFFFLNTPSRQKIEKPAKQKRSNIFKLNISPMVNKVNNIEKNREDKLSEEKRNNMFELGLSPVVKNNEKLETYCEKQKEESSTSANLFTLDMSPVVTNNKETSIDVIENYSEKSDNSNRNVMHEEKTNVAENIAPPSVLKNGHSVDISPSIYIQDTHIIPNPAPENIETPHASEIIDSSMETQGNSSALNIHSSFQPISQISSCITTILDTPVNGLGISGIEFINHSKYSARKQISGVGQLLGSIRNSESSSAILEASSSADITEFVTKRKRTRRTRSKKNKNKSIAEETLSPINSSISYTPKPMITDANPKQHIKFSDDGNIDDRKNDRENNSVISIDSDNGDLQLVEENILKAPLMSEKGPNVGNIISFKILKITDDFTPEVSSYIIGRVVDFSEKSKLVLLEITFGLDQFELPRGKFSLDDKEKRSISVFRECAWPDLIQPRLIDP